MGGSTGEVLGLEDDATRHRRQEPRDPAAINTLSKAFLDSDADIRSVMRVLFNSDFFKAAQYQRVKCPIDGSNPAIARKSVVLPAPFEPTIATASPRRTSTSIPSITFSPR